MIPVTHAHAFQSRQTVLPKNQTQKDVDVQLCNESVGIVIDGVEIAFRLRRLLSDPCVERLKWNFSKYVASRYVLWNIKNFHRSGKLDSTKTKTAYFLGEYYPNLRASHSTFVKWMKAPLKFLLPSELNMLTHRENMVLEEFLTKHSRKKKMRSQPLQYRPLKVAPLLKQPRQLKDLQPRQAPVLCSPRHC